MIHMAKYEVKVKSQKGGGSSTKVLPNVQTK